MYKYYYIYIVDPFLEMFCTTIMKCILQILAAHMHATNDRVLK